MLKEDAYRKQTSPSLSIYLLVCSFVCLFMSLLLAILSHYRTLAINYTVRVSAVAVLPIIATN